jgi:hypothetical protein
MTRANSSPLSSAIWLTFAAVFLGVFGWGVFEATSNWIREPNLLGIVGLALYGVVGFWFVAGAWLRTTWGRRFISRRRVKGRFPGPIDGSQGS